VRTPLAGRLSPFRADLRTDVRVNAPEGRGSACPPLSRTRISGPEELPPAMPASVPKVPLRIRGNIRRPGPPLDLSATEHPPSRRSPDRETTGELPDLHVGAELPVPGVQVPRAEKVSPADPAGIQVGPLRTRRKILGRRDRSVESAGDPCLPLLPSAESETTCKAPRLCKRPKRPVPRTDLSRPQKIPPARPAVLRVGSARNGGNVRRSGGGERDPGRTQPNGAAEITPGEGEPFVLPDEPSRSHERPSAGERPESRPLGRTSDRLV